MLLWMKQSSHFLRMPITSLFQPLNYEDTPPLQVPYNNELDIHPSGEVKLRSESSKRDKWSSLP